MLPHASSEPRSSFSLERSRDHCPARTRDPDAVALDAAVEVAAVLVLLEENLERIEERHAALVEHAAILH